MPEDPSADEEDANERTPLVSSAAKNSSQPTPREILLSPLFIASVLGLFIGLIKPIQRVVFGLTLDYTQGNWTWQAIGSGLYVLSIAFVAVDLIGTGATVKASEVHT